MIATLALAAAAGCGGDDPQHRPSPAKVKDTRAPAKPKTACALVPASNVRRVLARSGARPPRSLRAVPDESYELTSCIYRGEGGSVKLQIDTASRPLDRYFRALTERQQFYADKPRLRPRDVKGVGEDSAIGTAAANWVTSLRQLAAYGWETLVKVDVDARGADDDAARRSAVRLARIAFQRRDR